MSQTAAKYRICSRKFYHSEHLICMCFRFIAYTLMISSLLNVRKWMSLSVNHFACKQPKLRSDSRKKVGFL